ncbi:ABC transporter ATP-binding protein [Eggerthellaceae bacterium zg-1084]|uniref:ABC transporter ATP-binding protein n=1 Tax=Berryella wangjianweii TaxID=2734634 RepID=A0A6M8J4B3_9ACTN|nr:ABC transporter ATP-binding protein [Berryella wangjianweii]NPD31075.1 ABC transporter ATP-binding protein [Berryella wangjianweii]QKF07473.1 ABC transporter ATP-binding protein [Berryella wangjianweii]
MSVQSTSARRQSAAPAVSVQGLGFAYGEHRVLSGVSFSVETGSLVSLLGPNGTGKSTLFRCLLGLERGYEGQIRVQGREVRDLPSAQRARMMAYIPQSHRPIYDYDVIDVALMGGSAGGGAFFRPGAAHLRRAEEALERVGIAHLARASYTRISGGEQQLVLVARALAQGARILVMDEPTSALDFGNTLRVLECVKGLAGEGYAVIQSTHQPDQAFLYADQALVLHGGGVAAFGRPREVITSSLVSRIYGVDVRVASLCDDRVRVCLPAHRCAQAGVDAEAGPGTARARA